MTIGIIEGRTQGTEVWSPIAIGNANNSRGVRYIASLPKANATVKKPQFITMSFNKDGGASESDTPRRQRIYESYAPLLHTMCRALGVQVNSCGWSSKEIDRKHLRMVTFATSTELNVYLTANGIKTTLPDAGVSDVVIPQTGQTVEELYRELGKMIAVDPAKATAKAVVQQQLTDFKLTDDQTVELQRNLQAGLIKNAAANIAKRLESQANSDIAKLFKEFDAKNPPTIQLSTTVVAPVKQAKPAKEVVKK